MNTWYTVYVLYSLISVTFIHLSARILSKTNLTFLVESFHGDAERALLVDRVIIASFFLANVGFVVWNLPAYVGFVTARQAVAILLDKLGPEMLFVGFTLFLGLWIVARVRRLGAPSAVAR